jgi:hnRNP-L/PTB/hephaestus splicing factor
MEGHPAEEQHFANPATSESMRMAFDVTRSMPSNDGNMMCQNSGVMGLSVTQSLVQQRQQLLQQQNPAMRKYNQPTSVLYVKNIPSPVTDEEVVQNCSIFGKVVNTLFMRGKNYSFIQFDKTEDAVKCLNYYSQTPWQIVNPVNPMGPPITIEFHFSGRDQITRNERALVDGGIHSFNSNSKQVPNKILLITILHIIYPVTTYVLYQVFEKFGIQRCILFERATGLQALVELQDVKHAMAAKINLDNQFIYSGCNQLRIQFSNQQELIVRQNDEKSADFTLPSAKQIVAQAHAQAHAQAAAQSVQQHATES